MHEQLETREPRTATLKTFFVSIDNASSQRLHERNTMYINHLPHSGYIVRIAPRTLAKQLRSSHAFITKAKRPTNRWISRPLREWFSNRCITMTTCCLRSTARH